MPFPGTGPKHKTERAGSISNPRELYLKLFRILLLKGPNRRSFVVFYVEDVVELGDLKQIVNFLGEVQQFEFAAPIFGCGKGADQFADAGAIDIVDLAEV